MRLDAPRWWYGDRIPLGAWALLPVSILYGKIVESRLQTALPFHSKLPVICIGNFTVGGAGKTPLALKLASLLRARGRKPAFLSRGYGGSTPGPYLVDANGDGPDKVGDEPLLLAQCAPTVVSRDRAAGARLIEKLAADLIVMDDGFQNPALAKNFNLVVVDGEAGVGCGKVFPLGPLRAELRFQLAMAHAVVIIGKGKRKQQISAQLQNAGPSKAQYYEADIVPRVPDPILSSPVLAFCGIGRPSKFFETLQHARITVREARCFPDHYPYTEAEARSLIADAKALGATLVTTEKDRIRLRGRNGALHELYRAAVALPISVEFLGDGESRLLAAIDAAIEASMTEKAIQQ